MATGAIWGVKVVRLWTIFSIQMCIFHKDYTLLL